MEDYLLRISEIPGSTWTMNIPDIQHFQSYMSPKNIAFERYDEIGEEISLPRLHRAAFLGELDTVKSLISDGADLNEGDERGFSVLHFAAQAGHLEIVQLVLSYGADVNKETNLGATALHHASMDGNLDVTRLLIRHGATISKRCHDGTTALHLAARNGRLPVMKYLVSIGAEVDDLKDHGVTPLQLAAMNDHCDVVEYLISQGANVSHRNQFGMTALHLASFDGHVQVVEYLIGHGAKINEGGVSGMTALMIAARNDDLDVTQLLINHGAEVNKEGENGIPSALFIAASSGHLRVIKCLVEHGAMVNKEYRDEVTLLKIALEHGRIDIIEYLCSHGADVNKRSRSGKTALHSAVCNGQVAGMECLISHGASVNWESQTGDTLLHMAAIRDHVVASESLINHGLDVNKGGMLGLTAFHVAARTGNVSVMECLISHGAEVDKEGKDGWTALHLAALKGQIASTEFLINHGASIDKKTSAGDTALCIAASKGHSNVIQCLINHGCDVNQENNAGLTALHFAASKSCDASKCLIDHGAEVNKESREGATALHCAARSGHADVTECLISHGADMNKKADDGLTALHLAVIKGDFAVTECLLFHGAAIGSEIGRSTTLLHLAAKSNHLAILELLLDILISQSSGAPFTNEGGKSLIDKLDDDGFTALHLAIGEGHTAMVETLISHGADLNIKSRQGETCLHLAITMALSRKVHSTDTLEQIVVSYPEYNLTPEQALVIFLLDHGADPNIPDDQMKSPIHYVQDEMFYQLILEKIHTLKQSTEKSTEQPTPSELVSLPTFPNFWILMCLSSVLIDHLWKQVDNQPLGDLQSSDHSSGAAGNEDTNAESTPSSREAHIRLKLEDPRRTKAPIDERGGELHIPSYGFTLSVPPGALKEGSTEEITLEVLTDIPTNIQLQDDEIIVSHGFQCYPSGLQFREPVTLLIPHCAVFDDTDDVETALYSWDSLEKETPVRYRKTVDCMVSETHFILLLQHFSGGFLAILRKFLKGKLMSCMPYLPKKMPSSKQPVLEVRFVNKPKGMKWRDVHEYDPLDPRSSTRSAMDRDREVFIKRRNLEVQCQMANQPSESKNVEYRYFMHTTNHAVDFILNFQDCQACNYNITLTLAQKLQLAEIIFPTGFEDPPAAGQLVSGEEATESDGKHSDKQRTKKPNGGDKSHQDIATTIKKDPGARPKTSRDGGSCIQSQPGPSTKISSQIPSVIDSSEGELSSSSTEVPSVPQSSSVRDDDGATSVLITESKTSSAQSDGDEEHVDGSATSRAKKKKKKSRGARGGRNKKGKDGNLLPPSPRPPPPEIIDEVDSTASELDQMQLKDAAVAEEQIGAMAPDGSMPNILQRMVQGRRMQERTTNFAIYVDKMTINQPCGNTDSPSLVPVPTIVPVKLRRKLAVLMNKESPVGKDWKGLADELGLGEYITSLEDCKNPTEELIKLAESGQKIQNLHDLAEAFQRMGRADCSELCRSYALDLGRTCPPELTIDDGSDSSESF